jgi:PilZ domain
VDRQHRRLKVPFTAPAEIAPESSPAASVSANVAELSLYGCYMATPSPYAVQTLLRVKIFCAGEYFEAKATVIYSQPAKGMGLAFREIKPHFLAILKKWTLEAMNDQRNLD